MRRIGFLINPIAGMGGRVGLKGTDAVVDEAIALGAVPKAHERAAETLSRLRRLLAQSGDRIGIAWVTCAGRMGADSLRAAGFDNLEIVLAAAGDTTDEDTKSAVRSFLQRGVDLILFCGGDGTARDVCSVTGESVPILGIPSGVKMYSGVFGTSPGRTAEIVLAFLEGRLDLAGADVLDLDEERYRRGEWVVRLYCAAFTPHEPSFTQAAKMLLTDVSDVQAKNEIARFLLEEINQGPSALVLLGPGSTVKSIADLLGVDKTLLGVDAIAGGGMVGKDLNERQLLDLLGRYPHRKLIVSPLGAQGFVLGRGNLQLSPAVIRLIGAENMIVVATPAKLTRTPVLRFDTGDAALDAALAGRGYVPVVTGYRQRRLVRVLV